MKQKEILTINVRNNEPWPVRERSKSRRASENLRIYEYLRDVMVVGDKISVPLESETKAASLRCVIGQWRRLDGLTESLGYKTAIRRPESGGIVLWIGRIEVSDMRRTGKPYSKRPAAVPAVPPLPALPTLPRAGSQM